MRLTPAEYREECDRAAKRRAEQLAPIMLAAKAEMQAHIEARHPRRGRPKKIVIERRDPLEIPGRFRKGNN